MASGTRYLLRIPLMLLAAGELALLASRLQPWQEISNLPGQGTTGYDPLICLFFYLLAIFWIAGNRHEEVQKSLTSGLVLAIPAGLLAIGFVFVSEQHEIHTYLQQVGLLVAACIFPGIAGIRGTKFSKSPNVGIATGAWCAMIAAMMAVAVLLARIDLSNPVPQSSDPWKQYQGLAIGNPAVQALVHSLNMVSGFLLIAPLAGGLVALIFSMCAQD
jgi:hypothetical protein